MYILNVQIANLIYSFFNLPNLNELSGEYILNECILNRATSMLSSSEMKSTIVNNIPKSHLPDKWRRLDNESILRGDYKFTRTSSINILKYILNKHRINYELYKTIENRKNIYILKITKDT